MKLSDLVIQEEAPEGDKPIELEDLLKYFPNTYMKAVKTLANSGRLVWDGKQVFTKSGEYGPALKQAVAEAEQFLRDEDTTVDITVEMDGSVADIDDGGDFTSAYPLDDFQEVYVGYSTKGKHLLIGFDCWIDEEIFNQDWDTEFEKTFGEDFDGDDPKHAKIFSKAWKEFKENSFIGALVMVDQAGHCELDLTMPGGFYKGIYNNSIFKHERAVDFRLD